MRECSCLANAATIERAGVGVGRHKLGRCQVHLFGLQVGIVTIVEAPAKAGCGDCKALGRQWKLLGALVLVPTDLLVLAPQTPSPPTGPVKTIVHAV
jgi:hypothetical protein